MKDVQNQKSKSQLDVDRVGIKHLLIPLIVLDKENKTQNTLARVNMYVDLPKQYKGTHMSRFLEIIYNSITRAISVRDLGPILEDMIKKFKAKIAHMDIEFPFFLEKIAPVTKKRSMLDYNCKFVCIKTRTGHQTLLSVEVPITTLCPCSKEISRFGAHNQRGNVKLQVILKKFIWIEDLIKLVEKQASCEIYPLLKREDEAYVTERAYKNPRFVEDIVRRVASKLKKIIELGVLC